MDATDQPITSSDRRLILPDMRSCAVLADRFWEIVEQARSDAGVIEGRWDVDAVAAALRRRLAPLPPAEIVDFYYAYHDIADRLHQWEVCGATFLITGYISDNSLENFKAGLIATGRAAFGRVVVDPDNLAEHPIVADIAAGRLERSALSSEEFHLATAYAYQDQHDDDPDAFWDALDASDPPTSTTDRATQPTSWNGQFGDPGDGELLPVRLPRLTVLFAT